MASLLNQQINNTYQGLLKTENNGALGAGVTKFTDGNGTQTGMAVDKLNKDFRFIDNGGVNMSIENDAFTKANYPMSGTSGTYSSFNFKDSAGTDVAYFAMDRYGSIEYRNINGDQGETHYFTSTTAAGATTPAKIAMDTWDGPNNSSNWLIGYQRSLSAASYNSGTGDLTLNRTGASAIVVNIPSGGGGSAGLVNGATANSLTNADGLVTTPTEVAGPSDIVLGNAARSYSTGTNLYNAGGHVAIGQGAEVKKITDYSFSPSEGAVAIGKNAVATTGSNAGGGVAIGYNAKYNGTGSNAGVAIGSMSNATGDGAVVIGAGGATGTANYTVSVGYNSDTTAYHAIAIGSGALAAGGGFNTGSISIGAGVVTQSQFGVAIGTGSKIQNTTSNGGIVIGQMNASASSFQNSVAIGCTTALPSGLPVAETVLMGGGHSYAGSGFGSVIALGYGHSLTNSNDSVILGTSNTHSGGLSVIIGANSTATDGMVVIGNNLTGTRSGYATMSELDLKTVGGGIVMYSPDGTAYKLTIANGGTVSVSTI